MFIALMEIVESPSRLGPCDLFFICGGRTNAWVEDCHLSKSLLNVEKVIPSNWGAFGGGG